MGIIEKFKKIDKATVIRVAVFVVTLINMALQVFGVYGFSGELWFRVLSVAAVLISGACVAWENNDFTFFARIATGILDALEDGKITIDEVEDLLEEADDKSDETK